MKNPEKQLVGRNDISMRKNSKMIAILDYKIIMNFIFSKILKILRYKDFLDILKNYHSMKYLYVA